MADSSTEEARTWNDVLPPCTHSCNGRQYPGPGNPRSVKRKKDRVVSAKVIVDRCVDLTPLAVSHTQWLLKSETGKPVRRKRRSPLRRELYSSLSSSPSSESLASACSYRRSSRKRGKGFVYSLFSSDEQTSSGEDRARRRRREASPEASEDYQLPLRSAEERRVKQAGRQMRGRQGREEKPEYLPLEKEEQQSRGRQKKDAVSERKTGKKKEKLREKGSEQVTAQTESQEDTKQLQYLKQRERLLTFVWPPPRATITIFGREEQKSLPAKPSGGRRAFSCASERQSDHTRMLLRGEQDNEEYAQAVSFFHVHSLEYLQRLTYASPPSVMHWKEQPKPMRRRSSRHSPPKRSSTFSAKEVRTRVSFDAAGTTEVAAPAKTSVKEVVGAGPPSKALEGVSVQRQMSASKKESLTRLPSQSPVAAPSPQPAPARLPSSRLAVPSPQPPAEEPSVRSAAAAVLPAVTISKADVPAAAAISKTMSLTPASGGAAGTAVGAFAAAVAAQSVEKSSAAKKDGQTEEEAAEGKEKEERREESVEEGKKEETATSKKEETATSKTLSRRSEEGAQRREEERVSKSGAGEKGKEEELEKKSEVGEEEKGLGEKGEQIEKGREEEVPEAQILDAFAAAADDTATDQTKEESKKEEKSGKPLLVLPPDMNLSTLEEQKKLAEQLKTNEERDKAALPPGGEAIILSRLELPPREQQRIDAEVEKWNKLVVHFHHTSLLYFKFAKYITTKVLKVRLYGIVFFVGENPNRVSLLSGRRTRLVKPEVEAAYPNSRIKCSFKSSVVVPFDASANFYVGVVAVMAKKKATGEGEFMRKMIGVTDALNVKQWKIRLTSNAAWPLYVPSDVFRGEPFPNPTLSGQIYFWVDGYEGNRGPYLPPDQIISVDVDFGAEERAKLEAAAAKAGAAGDAKMFGFFRRLLGGKKAKDAEALQQGEKQFAAGPADSLVAIPLPAAHRPDFIDILKNPHQPDDKTKENMAVLRMMYHHYKVQESPMKSTVGVAPAAAAGVAPAAAAGVAPAAAAALSKVLAAPETPAAATTGVQQQQQRQQQKVVLRLKRPQMRETEQQQQAKTARGRALAAAAARSRDATESVGEKFPSTEEGEGREKQLLSPQGLLKKFAHASQPAALKTKGTSTTTRLSQTTQEKQQKPTQGSSKLAPPAAAAATATPAAAATAKTAALSAKPTAAAKATATAKATAAAKTAAAAAKPPAAAAKPAAAAAAAKQAAATAAKPAAAAKPEAAAGKPSGTSATRIGGAAAAAKTSVKTSAAAATFSPTAPAAAAKSNLFSTSARAPPTVTVRKVT